MQDKLLLRCVVQRAKHAEVMIDGKSQGQFDYGLVILFGVGFTESPDELSEEEVPHILNQFNLSLEKLAEKLISLRIFEDAEGKMNLSVKDIKGGLYLVSQFTLFGDCRKGNRPSFTQSAKPLIAKPLYEKLLNILKVKMAGMPVYSGILRQI